jgi:2'-5' RNA ligase
VVSQARANVLRAVAAVARAHTAPRVVAPEQFIDVPDGVMVAFYPAPALARRIALPGGEPTADLHVTLALPGKLSDLSPELRRRLPNIVRGFAMLARPLEGRFGGVTEFPAHEGTKPVVLLVDVPGLPAWRQRLVEILGLNGYAVASDHGYIPHLTLKYAPEKERVNVAVPGDVLRFDSITLVMGGEKRAYKLGGNPDIDESFHADAFAAPRPRRETAAVNAYQARLEAELDDWIAAGLPQFAEVEDDDSREELLALLLLLLLTRLKARAGEAFPESIAIGLGKVRGARATAGMAQALEAALASNSRYLETSLLPALADALRGALAAGGDTAANVAAAVGGLRARVGMYAGALHSLIQQVTGIAARETGRRIFWRRDPQSVHCESCLQWGDREYESYDAMLAETGGVEPANGTICLSKCRCILEPV